MAINTRNAVTQPALVGITRSLEELPIRVKKEALFRRMGRIGNGTPGGDHKKGRSPQDP